MPSRSRLSAVLFTDLVGSVQLKRDLGLPAYRDLVIRHDTLFREIVQSIPGAEIRNDTGDGFLARFNSASDAVSAALRFQHAVHSETWGTAKVAARVGVHVGETEEMGNEETTGRPKLIGLAVDVAARVMGLAEGGQILLTRTAFDDARQYLQSHPSLDADESLPLEWVSHDRYLFKGNPDPLEVFEVGVRGMSPLRPPADGDKATRATSRSVQHDLSTYRAGRIAEWSQSRYRLDKEFVSLTLLIDQGEDSAAGRWGAQPETYRDLRGLLGTIEDRALVILGPPGSGKSTLLRRFELDIAQAALAAGDDRSPSTSGNAAPSEAGSGSPLPLTFFVQLNHYKSGNPGEPLPEPRAWLAERWRARFPELPPLQGFLDAGRMVLLLDGLNEMPAAGPGGNRQSVVRWKEFIERLASERPGNRVVFSCRALDYSAPLSSSSLRVPQVVIEPLTDEQVEQCLLKIDKALGSEIWEQLRGTTQLEAMRSPYFLGLLMEQASSSGEIPRGRASLFTGFVRRALRREVERDNPLFAPEYLLSERDVRRIAGGKWGDPWALPERGVLIPKLSELAFGMQKRSEGGDASQVRIDYDEALGLLDDERDEQIVRAGEALSVLDEDSVHGEVKFFHQLVQEYFAARILGAKPEPDRLRTPWRSAEIVPPLAELIERIPAAETLPPVATTGWEETALMAAAMSADTDGFIRGLMEANLALAGRCAAQPEVLPSLTPLLLGALREALVARSHERDADLRWRIEAALALGSLGDPRFERIKGPLGTYLLPPMVEIGAGRYPLGHDEPFESLGDRWTDHVPRHEVEISSFRIGRFPVTNGEWAHFIASGAYEDERWWDSAAALAWQSGDGTAEGTRSQVRYWVARFRAEPGELDRRWATRSIAEEIYERWKRRLAMTEAAFEAHLKELYPGGPLREPLFWRDRAWNNPIQPVVGICWFEARAYALWLAAQTGASFRLPSEAQWEAAARGVAGRTYAHGNEFHALAGNTAAARIRRATPMGVFVEGETPEGVSDLTGNIEEWTSSLFGAGGPNDAAGFRYPYRADDGREDPMAGAQVRRVLRGGGWATPRELCDAASRVDAPPDYRFNHNGFRLAMNVAP